VVTLRSESTCKVLLVAFASGGRTIPCSKVPSYNIKYSPGFVVLHIVFCCLWFKVFPAFKFIRDLGLNGGKF
jgi:hypothetical protein